MSSSDAVGDWRSLIAAREDLRARTELALGFEIRVRDPAAHAWAPRTLRTASPRMIAQGEGEFFLGIRPLRRSDSTGAWVQSEVSWDSVRRSAGRFGVAQVRWFSDLLSISRDSLLSGTAGEWLLLDHVESSLLWAHLRAAAGLGIPFVCLQKGFSLTLADSASLVADVARDDDDELLLSGEAMIDGRRMPSAQVRALGPGGVYTLRVHGARIEVILAELPLSAPARALLTAGGTMRVPAADEAEFLREAYPALARRVELRAAPEVRLPSLPLPQPTLVVTHHRGDAVDYAVEWTYRGFGRYPVDTDAGDDPVRDRAEEDLRRPRLAESWEAATGQPFTPRGTYYDVDAAEFVARIVPALGEAGLAVVTVGSPKRYHELTGTPEITVTTVESTDPDWFELGILVTIDGRSIPFTPLFTALTQRRTKLKLVDGSYFSLAHPALDRLRELIDEAVELAEWETGPRIHRTHIALWEDFEDLADRTVEATAWRRAVEGLRATDGDVSVAAPRGLRATLRPYQQHGFERLALLWRHRLGGILADDMGLGKTVQILALLLHAREERSGPPFLVVAPTSVLSTWVAEAARFAPELRIALVDRTRRVSGRALGETAAEADVIVTSYAILRLDAAEFTAQRWAAVVLDEAQFVKNPRTILHQTVRDLPADAVFAVTGTPLENSLSELWALLALTATGLFPSARRFRHAYVQPIEQGKVPENAEGGDHRAARLADLRRRIRPFVLRRTKELVARDLPPKQTQVLPVELSPAHRARYDTVLQRERQKILGLLDDLDRQRFIVFRSLTLLRRLASAPALIDPADAPLGSRKLDALLERVRELQAEGHRALVFSQFTSFLRLAAERLEAADIPYALLDGSTRRRDEVIAGFRDGGQPVFLISLKAGGFGLTLTEADYVFLLDPWWNPAAEEQAIDRTHRIGQTAPVLVYRMIAADTIEEKVHALQQRKARLFRAVMDDEDALARALTAEDIRGLLDA